MKKKYILLPAAVALVASAVTVSIVARRAKVLNSATVALAKGFLDHFNKRSYEECFDDFNEMMQDAMSTHMMALTYDPLLDTLGEFKRIRRANVSYPSTNGTGFVVCNLKVEYENGLAAFTLLFDENGQIGGLYIK